MARRRHLIPPYKKQSSKGIAYAPRVFERTCGGWMAVTIDGGLRIGVTAPSEQEVREEYRQAWSAWIKLLGPPKPTNPIIPDVWKFIEPFRPRNENV